MCRRMLLVLGTLLPLVVGGALLMGLVATIGFLLIALLTALLLIALSRQLRPPAMRCQTPESPLGEESG